MKKVWFMVNELSSYVAAFDSARIEVANAESGGECKFGRLRMVLCLEVVLDDGLMSVMGVVG